ncbi:hypothetical protein WS75_05505 [Burkholderia sp. FL-7-2-10-S1-D7]|uniref:hypothetical protein n=1 Tax=Burkholderia sp. FL-7-2-10-S1-D7 TaxID=1637866 RepID=UPI0007561368|nr:hypothetical protein [Burkholderia sp. FL-7-2-10-S1-D7]KVF79227.1 hypothetical protein WS75_05505 [Burkholderia sp. FL-7-2-10-S1-D7]
MTIPTLEYRGRELRVYSQMLFPPFGDPHAPGPKRFASIVRIATIPATSATAPRYSTIFEHGAPQTAALSLEPAMQFGKDIVDGKIAPAAI